MKAHSLGHVVFYVKDLQRSLVFYRDLLGFKEVGRVFNGAAAALTSGRTRYERLLILVGNLSPSRLSGYIPSGGAGNRHYICQSATRGEDRMSTTNLQQPLNDLFSYIWQGKINEAMNEFYDRNMVMQDYVRHRVTRFP